MNLHPKTLDFLNKLKKNNNRDWFQDNKPLYTEINQNFADFLNSLIAGIAKFDKEITGLDGKKSIFRIYRDVRFSKDKSPYKINMGAHLVTGGKKNQHDKAGYYIHLQPGGSFLAGGAYMPPAPWLKNIRSELALNADEFRKILNSKDFKNYFGELEGESLKTAPRDYPKNHPEIELLKRKSFLAVHNLDDKTVLSDKFYDHCLKVFKALYPFDQYLNQASAN